MVTIYSGLWLYNIHWFYGYIIHYRHFQRNSACIQCMVSKIAPLFCAYCERLHACMHACMHACTSTLCAWCICISTDYSVFFDSHVYTFCVYFDCFYVWSSKLAVWTNPTDCFIIMSNWSRLLIIKVDMQAKCTNNISSKRSRFDYYHRARNFFKLH